MSSLFVLGRKADSGSRSEALADGTFFHARLRGGLFPDGVFSDARLNARLFTLEKSVGDSVFGKNRLFARLFTIEKSDAESSIGKQNLFSIFRAFKIRIKTI